MQKLIFVSKQYVDDVNDYLSSGWRVISIHPVTQVVSTASSFSERGDYGCYVLIERT